MNSRSTSDYDYPYPASAIAQHPLEDRAGSRLLVLERTTGETSHRQFRDLPNVIQPGDLLVTNTSRVIKARLRGVRENGREAELLLIHPREDGTWLAMVHPGGKLKVGRTIRFGDDSHATVVEMLRGGLRRVELSGLDAGDLMARFGETPLPPYITRPPDALDGERYQTVFAKEDGSVAAPTAGLHFTNQLLEQLEERGVKRAEVVLHVGPGTFKPVECEDTTHHVIHAEWYSVSRDAARAINQAKEDGSRVWAVGTTVVRTLEAAVSAAALSRVEAKSDWTDLFIYPPHEFKIVDAMVTNFHLPRSTLLMLVAAFAGYDRTMAAYREAIEHGYRLYSYGDAMAIA